VAQLGIDLGWIHDGGSNLLAQQLTIPAPEAVHHFLDRSLCRAEPLGSVLVRRSRLAASQIVFELLQLGLPTSLCELLTESGDRTLQNREGPPPFEERLGIQDPERLLRILSLRFRCVDRQ
jgi:hypothetical protein